MILWLNGMGSNVSLLILEATIEGTCRHTTVSVLQVATGWTSLLNKLRVLDLRQRDHDQIKGRRTAAHLSSC